MALTSHDQVPTQVLDGAVREYSRDKIYVLTALFLGAVTVVEVLTYASPDFILWRGNMVVVVLLLLMAVKFFTVAYIFMHLRFDNKILTYCFYAGLALAVVVYVAVLSMFRIWWPGEHS